MQTMERRPGYGCQDGRIIAEHNAGSGSYKAYTIIAVCHSYQQTIIGQYLACLRCLYFVYF